MILGSLHAAEPPQVSEWIDSFEASMHPYARAELSVSLNDLEFSTIRIARHPDGLLISQRKHEVVTEAIITDQVIHKQGLSEGQLFVSGQIENDHTGSATKLPLRASVLLGMPHLERPIAMSNEIARSEVTIEGVAGFASLRLTQADLGSSIELHSERSSNGAWLLRTVDYHDEATDFLIDDIEYREVSQCGAIPVAWRSRQKSRGSYSWRLTYRTSVTKYDCSEFKFEDVQRWLAVANGTEVVVSDVPYPVIYENGTLVPRPDLQPKRSEPPVFTRGRIWLLALNALILLIITVFWMKRK